MAKEKPVKTPAGEDSPEHHFSTKHLSANIGKRTVSSGLIRGGSQAAQFVLTLGFNLIQARLLSPEEYGLVAMVMTAIELLQAFRDMGLSTATIQREDITHAQVSNLFWLNAAGSGLISLLLAACAPLIARFYHEPRLVNITLAISVYFLLNGLAGQHVALLNRQMRFLATSVIEVSSMAAGFIIGIVMAMTGFSYWALVAATISTAFIRLVAVWSVSRWRPQRPVRGAGTRPLVSFGVNLTVSYFLFSASHSCAGLFVGRRYGSDALGLYSRAGALLARPMFQLTAPIQAVIVPALSRLQDKPAQYRHLYLKVFEGMAFAGFFFTGFFLPLARPVTVTLLGSQWDAASPIFAALSVAALYIPLFSATTSLYNSQGRGRDSFMVHMWIAVIVVISVMIGLPYGPTGVATALSTGGVTARLPCAFYFAGRTGPVSTRDLWVSYLQQLPVLIVVGVIEWFLYRAVAGMTPVRQLLICTPVGVLAGLATLMVSPFCREMRDGIFSVIRSRMKRSTPAASAS